MKTFRDVGVKEGLEGNTLERYVSYMQRRWKSEEETQCQTGYAAEWAQRFKGGWDYSASDVVGKSVLRDIDSEELS